MIPKIIHQIWIGLNPIPSDFITFSDKWKEMYSDVDYMLWDDITVTESGILSGELLEYYNNDTLPIAFKADILRYKIIEAYGGIYVDMDTEPLRRMGNEVFDLSFFSGIQNNGEVAIGIFGAERNNPFMTEVCKQLPINIKYKFSRKVPIKHVDMFSGPVFFTNLCNTVKNEERFKFFEPKYFYPYWFTETHRRNENFKETCPDAYSVHHWAHSWKYE